MKKILLLLALGILYSDNACSGLQEIVAKYAPGPHQNESPEALRAAVNSELSKMSSYGLEGALEFCIEEGESSFVHEHISKLDSRRIRIFLTFCAENVTGHEKTEIINNNIKRIPHYELVPFFKDLIKKNSVDSVRANLNLLDSFELINLLGDSISEDAVSVQTKKFLKEFLLNTREYSTDRIPRDYLKNATYFNNINLLIPKIKKHKILNEEEFESWRANMKKNFLEMFERIGPEHQSTPEYQLKWINQIKTFQLFNEEERKSLIPDTKKIALKQMHFDILNTSPREIAAIQRRTSIILEQIRSSDLFNEEEIESFTDGIKKGIKEDMLREFQNASPETRERLITEMKESGLFKFFNKEEIKSCIAEIKKDVLSTLQGTYETEASNSKKQEAISGLDLNQQIEGMKWWGEEIKLLHTPEEIAASLQKALENIRKTYMDSKAISAEQKQSILNGIEYVSETLPPNEHLALIQAAQEQEHSKVTKQQLQKSLTGNTHAKLEPKLLGAAINLKYYNLAGTYTEKQAEEGMKRLENDLRTGTVPEEGVNNIKYLGPLYKRAQRLYSNTAVEESFNLDDPFAPNVLLANFYEDAVTQGARTAQDARPQFRCANGVHVDAYLALAKMYNVAKNTHYAQGLGCPME